MDAAKLPQNLVSIVNTLDGNAIAARLRELDAEASALRVLLRSARARENARRREPQKKAVAHE
jgi:hypothetical protein